VKEKSKGKKRKATVGVQEIGWGRERGYWEKGRQKKIEVKSKKKKKGRVNLKPRTEQSG